MQGMQHSCGQEQGRLPAGLAAHHASWVGGVLHRGLSGSVGLGRCLGLGYKGGAHIVEVSGGQAGGSRQGGGGG